MPCIRHRALHRIMINALDCMHACRSLSGSSRYEVVWRIREASRSSSQSTFSVSGPNLQSIPQPSIPCLATDVSEEGRKTRHLLTAETSNLQLIPKPQNSTVSPYGYVKAEMRNATSYCSFEIAWLMVT